MLTATADKGAAGFSDEGNAELAHLDVIHINAVKRVVANFFNF